MEQFNKSQRPKNMSNTWRNAAKSVAIGLGILSSGSAINEKIEAKLKYPSNYSEQQKKIIKSELDKEIVEKVVGYQIAIANVGDILNKIKFDKEEAIKYWIKAVEMNDVRKDELNSEFLLLLNGIYEIYGEYNLEISDDIENVGDVLRKNVKLESHRIILKADQTIHAVNFLTENENLEDFKALLIYEYFVMNPEFQKAIEQERESRNEANKTALL